MNKDENKVFVITTGEYSDYTIDRVFSTRRKANDYLDTKADSYRLEVFDLDEPVERKTQIYEISFELDKKKVWSGRTMCDVRYKDTIHIGGRYLNNRKILDIYVESDSRKRALKIASERYGAIIASEQTMYPYLRVGVLRHYSSMCPAFFDFKTGEMVLFDREELAVELPDFIKVRRAEPLKKR
jgi:hypothetical protein